MYLSLSTGVGTAIIVDGDIARGMQTSECGLMIMTDSSDFGNQYTRLEDIASGSGFKRRFNADPEHTTNSLVWSAYAEGLSRCLFNISVMFFSGSNCIGRRSCKPIFSF